VGGYEASFGLWSIDSLIVCCWFCYYYFFFFLDVSEDLISIGKDGVKNIQGKRFYAWSCIIILLQWMASSLVEVSVFKFWKRRRKSLTARMHERQKDRSRFSIFRRKKKEMEMFGYMVCTTTIVGTGTMASTGGKYILQFPSEINEYIMQMRLIYSFVHTHTHICVLRFLTRYSGRGKKKIACAHDSCARDINKE